MEFKKFLEPEKRIELMEILSDIESGLYRVWGRRFIFDHGAFRQKIEIGKRRIEEFLQTI